MDKLSHPIVDEYNDELPLRYFHCSSQFHHIHPLGYSPFYLKEILIEVAYLYTYFCGLAYPLLYLFETVLELFLILLIGAHFLWLELGLSADALFDNTLDFVKIGLT